MLSASRELWEYKDSALWETIRMVEISEIWIITEAGIPLFNRSVDQQMDMFTLGGFLSAIQTFIQSSFQEEKLNCLVLGESKLTFGFAKDYNIFFIIRTNKKVKDKVVLEKLELIKNLFIANYKDQLKQFVTSCDVTDFLDFNKVLDEHLAKELMVKRMQDWFENV